QHKAVDVEVMPVDLPAPRVAWRGGAKRADPIKPFSVFVGLAGDLKGVLIEPHDIAGARVPRRAHGFAQKTERGLALILLEVGKANAMPHEPGVNVGPFSPCQIVDRERRSPALFFCQLCKEGARRLQEWGE